MNRFDRMRSYSLNLIFDLLRPFSCIKLLNLTRKQRIMILKIEKIKIVMKLISELKIIKRNSSFIKILRNDCQIIKQIIEKIQGFSEIFDSNIFEYIGQGINSLFLEKEHSNFLLLINIKRERESKIISSILKHNVKIRRLEILNCNLDENLNVKVSSYLKINSGISGETLGKIFNRLNNQG